MTGTCSCLCVEVKLSRRPLFPPTNSQHLQEFLQTAWQKSNEEIHFNETELAEKHKFTLRLWRPYRKRGRQVLEVFVGFEFLCIEQSHLMLRVKEQTKRLKSLSAEADPDVPPMHRCCLKVLMQQLHQTVDRRAASPLSVLTDPIKASLQRIILGALRDFSVGPPVTHSSGVSVKWRPRGANSPLSCAAAVYFFFSVFTPVLRRPNSSSRRRELSHSVSCRVCHSGEKAF